MRLDKIRHPLRQLESRFNPIDLDTFRLHLDGEDTEPKLIRPSVLDNVMNSLERHMTNLHQLRQDFKIAIQKFGKIVAEDQCRFFEGAEAAKEENMRDTSDGDYMESAPEVVDRSADELSVYDGGGSGNAVSAEAVIPTKRTPKRKRSRAEAELSSSADGKEDLDDISDWQQKNAIVIRRVGTKMTPTVTAGLCTSTTGFWSRSSPACEYATTDRQSTAVAETRESI